MDVTGTPSQPLDLLHTQWSADAFKTTTLTVQPGKKPKVVVTPPTQQGQPIKPGSSSWIKNVHAWATGDHSGLHQVVKALDQLAEEAIGQQETEETSDKSKKEPLPSRLNHVSKRLQEMRLLNENLQEHDHLVAEHNNTLYLGKKSPARCPTHQKTIQKVSEQIETLERLQHTLKSALKGLVNKQLKELAAAVRDGLPVDRAFIAERYPLFLKGLEELDRVDPNAAAILLDRYQGLIDFAYLDNLQHQLWKGDFQLPPSLTQSLALLGVSHEEYEKAFNEGNKEFLQKINTYLKSDQLSATEPAQLVAKIQDELWATLKPRIPALASLNDNQMQLLKSVTHALDAFELEFFQEKNLEKIKNSLIQTLARSEGEQEAFLKEMPELLAQFPLGELIRQTLSPFKESIKQAILKADPQRCEAMIRKINENLSLRRFSYLQNARLITDKKSEAVGEWEKKNAPYRCFAFSQSRWGKNATLGKGVCYALNYRWIKGLISAPTKPLTSVKDLSPTTSASFVPPEEQAEGVGSRDRFLQALYASEHSVHRSIPKQVIEREKMKEVRPLGNTIFRTIDNLIDAVERKRKAGKLDLNASGGAVEVGAYVEKIDTDGEKEMENGHSLGFQIYEGPGGPVYSFWDVNEGFYRYPTLQQMKTAFQEYIEVKYHPHKPYNHFDVTQFKPIS